MQTELRSVFLIGMMGAGKSTVGRLLAQQLNYQFIDADRELEARSGVPIPTIFEIEGEAGFRRREMGLLDELTRRPGIVLATGGGAVLDVRVNKDSRGVDTSAGPAIDTKNVQTQVLVENGGTVVLGGIYEQTDRTTVTKVPFLGDLPVVGVLFKNTASVNDRTELIIFITPRVISERVNAAMR